MSQAKGEAAPWLSAFFTATSAVCVTGLVVVDTGTYWSSFGQWVILGLFQIGGFGMMTAATMLGLMVNRSLPLRAKLITQVETHTLRLGDIGSVARLVLVVTLVTELTTALWLTVRLHLGYHFQWGEAAWSGWFHAVSAFNNAGFSIHPDSLMRYAADASMLVPVMVAIVVGGIGFPVLYDLREKLRGARRLSLHTRLTLVVTGVLLLGGFLALLLFEWTNPKTLGPMPFGEKLLSAAFASVSARTAGFNSLDVGAMRHESWALHFFLMFVGGGSAGTAGGVKIGTIAILALLVIAEIRGRGDIEAFGRRVSVSAQRQAITVVALGAVMITVGTLIILHITDFPTDQVIFEVVSAFSTVGLSTGITGDLPAPAQFVIITLMYVGRVGTITFATSLILVERRAQYSYPEEHPIVG
ncbi:trk system potassium uptake protein TrkH [Paraburkholderia sp. CI2]|uniref:TrkH family potassium uptake protein n=1 Tax=Paraburkholderia sp. CI2 TaxID=2723093 RepID=UPI001838504B|nr:potassium transporter TrkG [Paraburkholderia sp. CI2]MBB5467411.1 trk system potassium uptake protein TrkH [Paraburkholderia sp. CI2]